MRHSVDSVFYVWWFSQIVYDGVFVWYVLLVCLHIVIWLGLYIQANTKMEELKNLLKSSLYLKTEIGSALKNQ